jgi:hypothetical protein
LCRKLGLVLGFIVFGLVVGANGVAVFMADPDPMHAMALAPAEARDSAISSLPTATAQTKAVEATLTQKTSNASGIESPCRENITERLGSDCTSGKARKPRPVQAINERPAIAAVLIGHRAGSAVLPSHPEIPVAATPHIPDGSAKPEDAAEAAPASIVKESPAPAASTKRSRTHRKYVQRRDQDDRKYVQRRNRNEYSPSSSYSYHNYYQGGYARVW